MSLLWAARKVVHALRLRRLQRLGEGLQWMRVPARFWMQIDKSNWLGRTIAMGYYESDLVYLIYQIVREGDGCIDVGANIGYISMHCAQACGKHGRVLSVEASPIVYEILLSHIERNHFQQIIPKNAFDGDTHRQIEFYHCIDEPGHSSFINKGFSASRISIPMYPVDEIWQEIVGSSSVPVTFVKIDVEGAEPLVLEGMRRTVRLYQPLFWIEVNPPLLCGAGFSEEHIFEFLHSYQYHIFLPFWRRDWMGRPNLTLCPFTPRLVEQRQLYNIIAVNPNSEAGLRLKQSRIRIIRQEE